MNKLPGSSWVEIDLGAIQDNLSRVRAKLGPDTKILGVVKADAYGHGALEISRFLVSRGIAMLGVTSVQEARHLREGGIEAPILIFGPFLPEEIQTIIDYNLIATVADYNSIDLLESALSGQRREIRVHLKIETGMGRLGFWPTEALKAAGRIRATTGLVLDGVYSHLSTAMYPGDSYALKQISCFKSVLAELKAAGITGFTAHLANSAAVLNYPEAHLDMVRVGTLLYGQAPAGLDSKIELRDPWSLKTRVVYLKELPAGHSVGYGRTYTTRRKTKMALLPLGFVDGIAMEPTLRPSGLLDLLKGLAKLLLLYLGHSRMRIPVIFPDGKGYVMGKPGMQLTMVDVTGLRSIEVGTTACIKARRTAVNPLITKVYLENGRIVGISDFRVSKKEEIGVQ